MTWEENVVNVIRGLFADSELKTMMMIPAADASNLALFRDKYFVREPVSDNIMFKEPVVIRYGNEEPVETDSEHIINDRLMLHIYVRESERYTYGDDRMIHRGHAIATKLHHLFCKKRWANIRFSCRGIYDLPSKIEGYDHVCVVLRYKRIYV